MRWLAAHINPADYGKAVLTAGVTLAVIALAQNILAIHTVYLVPLVLVASRWGRGPAIVAVGLSFVFLDVFFVEPSGSLRADRPEEALGLALLLGTSFLTAEWLAGARQRSQALEDLTLSRLSDQFKTAFL